MNEQTKKGLPFAIPTDAPRIIKVIGVGGGGSNAVHNMYRKGIHNVSFAVCNTDIQALQNSPIPKKIQLGETITEGLGAGNDPEVARRAAEESREEITALFNDGTSLPAWAVVQVPVLLRWLQRLQRALVFSLSEL